jgi:hypothetical protein
MSRKSSQFRPTLDGTLEERIALASGPTFLSGLPIVTTHTYNEVLINIDLAFRRFRASDAGPGDYGRLRDRLAAQDRRIPFGNQNLVPLIPDALNGLTKNNANAVRDSVKSDVRSYLRDNIVVERNFAWLQSNDRHSSDNDFGPRFGRV